MIYGARLMEATRSLRISDPEFAANLDEHVRQCVFYDLLLGRYSMKQLAESDDIWTTIAPGSAARAQKFPDPPSR
jgi:conjugal transfer mating pair stabilization protein TraG